MIIPAILIAIVFTAIYYKKSVPELQPENRWFLAALRFISITIVLILLLNPILHFKRSNLEKPVILVLNDTSQSMEQTGEQGSKKELLQLEFLNLKNEIDNYEIIEHNFASGLNGAASNTLLTPTLDKLLKKYSSRNLNSIILLSDGWFKDENLDIISNLNIPIYAIVPEFSQTDFDLSFTKIHLNKETYQDDITPLICDISALNFLGKAEVKLIINDKSVSHQIVDFSQSSYQQVTFEHSFSQTGLNLIETEITAIDTTNSSAEVDLANNRLQSAIQVKNSKANVLMISDIFDWELKFIKDVVKKDEKYNLDILIKKDQLWDAKDEVKLAPYFEETKVLILRNSSGLQFSADEIQLINQFHDNGGGVLFLGEQIPELNNLYPATSLKLRSMEKSNFQLNDISRKFQTFNFEDSNELNNIPPVDFFYVNAKLGAEVLASFNNTERSPAIVVDQSSAGTILYMPLSGLYRWQMWDKDGTYQQFWANLISWLSLNNENKTYSYTDKTSYSQGEDVKLFLQSFDEKLEFVPNLTVQAGIIDSTGKRVEEKLMISGTEFYRCEFTELQPGNYNYKISIKENREESSGSFFVTAFSPEAYDRGFNYPLISYLCSNSEGKATDDYKQLETEFSNPESKEIITTTEIPLYRKWYLIALFLLSFCLELYLRKRWGLL